jgi:hypothetical protein
VDLDLELKFGLSSFQTNPVVDFFGFTDEALRTQGKINLF